MVLAIIVAVVAFVVYAAYFAPQVQVTGINFVSPDNACGLDGWTDNGFNATPGTSFELTYQIYNNNSPPCTIVAVTTTTTGFNISAANIPLTVPSNASQLLSFSVDLPSSDYVGVLTLVFT